MSDVEEGPIRVTLFVPLSESSKNSIKPAEVAPFFTDIPALNTSLAADVEIPVCVVAPLISTAPLISIVVAVRSISSVAPIERTVALDPWTNWLASLKHNLLVEFSVKPVPSVCVKVVSESAPNLRTASSDKRDKSSSTVKSTTLKEAKASTTAAPEPAPSK